MSERRKWRRAEYAADLTEREVEAELCWHCREVSRQASEWRYSMGDCVRKAEEFEAVDHSTYMDHDFWHRRGLAWRVEAAYRQ